MDCPVIWPVVRAGNSPGNARISYEREDEENMKSNKLNGEFAKMGDRQTCFVTLLQLNKSVDEITSTLCMVQVITLKWESQSVSKSAQINLTFSILQQCSNIFRTPTK